MNDERAQAIATIEFFYPPDSQYAPTAELGRQLLEEAKANVGSWRNEPLDVLQELARLCQRENSRPIPNPRDY